MANTGRRQRALMRLRKVAFRCSTHAQYNAYTSLYAEMLSEALSQIRSLEKKLRVRSNKRTSFTA